MIKCNSEKENYSCKTKIGKYYIQSDVTLEKGGKQEGIRPHDILATAFASCLNISVRMACDKKLIPVDFVTSKVDLIREDSKTIFKYQIDFNEQLSEKLRQEILDMIENCPVRKTLSKPIEFQQI